MRNIHKNDSDFLSIKMPFGQYYGKKISSLLDTRYMKWLLANATHPKMTAEVEYAIFTRLRIMNHD